MLKVEDKYKIRPQGIESGDFRVREDGWRLRLKKGVGEVTGVAKEAWSKLAQALRVRRGARLSGSRLACWLERHISEHACETSHVHTTGFSLGEVICGVSKPSLSLANGRSAYLFLFNFRYEKKQ